jgi:hypothetical protein
MMMVICDLHDDWLIWCISAIKILSGQAVTSGRVWNLVHSGPCACYEMLWGFTPSFVVEGGLDEHIRPLESIPPSPDYLFYVKRGRKRKWAGGRSGPLRPSACRVDLNHLDSRAVHKRMTLSWGSFVLV